VNKKLLSSLVYRRYSTFVDAVNRNALLTQWIKANPPARTFRKRNDIYQYVAAELGGKSAIDLLEFGVAEGASLRAFAEANRNPESRFIGFDTFTGLPEDWQSGWGVTPKGSYAPAQGIPQFSDARISLRAGLFHETLPEFMSTFAPNKNKLIFYVDCDLHSSTLYLLTKLDIYRSVHPIILFDDFSNPLHVFRAFSDYVAAYHVSYRNLAAAGLYFDQVCIEIL
jgi:O-methyltransferase